MPDKYVVIFDTVALVQGTINPKGTARKCLDLSYRGIYVRNVRKHFTYPRDPNDETYLNLAIEVSADYLISRDHDLLDLMNWRQENKPGVSTAVPSAENCDAGRVLADYGAVHELGRRSSCQACFRA